MKIAITRLLITLFEKFFHQNDPHNVFYLLKFTLNRARREWVKGVYFLQQSILKFNEMHHSQFPAADKM